MMMMTTTVKTSRVMNRAKYLKPFLILFISSKTLGVLHLIKRSLFYKTLHKTVTL